MASTKVQRIMTQPINLIFRFLQSGFDEYMNLVLDDAEEVSIKNKSRKSLGRILLKGDNITLMMRGNDDHFNNYIDSITCLLIHMLIEPFLDSAV
ncbi:hypothetical protein Ddye_021743 [Dipteronia dyeriana]|uniref:Small nuclear ribonucleoprotein E n=1 Tax=Dipteronia dyeriana TaxID=168575 RepID=A0AAD9WXU3_9ROSI|nr:hypothetical protein Ddye_021743 [Dipteronia dyeriana]